MEFDMNQINTPDRLYTWVDVEAHLRILAENSQWPSWLLECDAYWDALEIFVSDIPNKAVLIEWLETAFGFGSIVTEGNESYLLLEGVSGSKPISRLAVMVTQSASQSVRREPRWAESRVFSELSEPILKPSDGFEGGVQIAAMYSFKGGVGRTLHSVALAENLGKRGKVLLIDGDLEAPGISWMYASTGKRIDFSYEDFLALLHSSSDNSALGTVSIAASYLPNQTFGNIIVLPARRNATKLATPRIQPSDLITSSRSPFFLTEAIAQLAVELGASTVLIDLRAGTSELSASVLLDPRVQRIYVTTVSSQSVVGTALTAGELNRKAPSELSPITIVTQYRPSDSRDEIAACLAPLTDVLANEVRELDEISANLAIEPFYSEFREELLALPSEWNDVVETVRRVGLVDLLNRVAEDLSSIKTAEPQEVESIDSEDTGLAELVNRRRVLGDFAGTLVYAETASVQDFMPTNSLRRLMESHRTELPICVAAGSKGAGKTFTQVQMCYRETWKSYAESVGVTGVTVDAMLAPVLTSSNMSEEVNEKIDTIREKASFGKAEDLPSRLNIRDAIKSGINGDISDKEWRNIWISCLAQSIGIEVEGNNAERKLAEFASQTSERRVFLIDGLEDSFQNVATNEQEQQGLRVLLTDCLEWLRSLRGRPFGLVVFVRRDLVRASVRQNSGQFLAKYQDFALAWNPSEALRLALWLTVVSGASSEISSSEVLEASDAKLSEGLASLWGEKMGTAGSREARTQGWFLAALSDFNGAIQARDIVLFMKESATKSIGDSRWSDRLLTPTAMRGALVVCSAEKIDAIGEETPKIAEILNRLKNLHADLKQVPIIRESMDLNSTEIGLLEDNGVIFREGDKYWIPEIFRHGLGFSATGRPRVLAIASLVRKRNNQD